MKPVTFKVLTNNEKVICEDTRQTQNIDGVEYIIVHKVDNKRPFLMRKDALERVKEKL